MLAVDATPAPPPSPRLRLLRCPRPRSPSRLPNNADVSVAVEATESERREPAPLAVLAVRLLPRLRLLLLRLPLALPRALLVLGKVPVASASPLPVPVDAPGFGRMSRLMRGLLPLVPPLRRLDRLPLRPARRFKLVTLTVPGARPGPRRARATSRRPSRIAAAADFDSRRSSSEAPAELDDSEPLPLPPLSLPLLPLTPPGGANAAGGGTGTYEPRPAVGDELAVSPLYPASPPPPPPTPVSGSVPARDVENIRGGGGTRIPWA